MQRLFLRLSQLAGAEVFPRAKNPAVLRKMPHFDYSPPPYTGPRTAEILRKRSEFLSPAVSPFYKKPLNIVDGSMQFLFDEDGRRYLDAFGGIATVSCGHCHPEVIEAIMSQMKRVQHSTVLYLNHAIVDFAEKLASKFPGDLKAVKGIEYKKGSLPKAFNKVIERKTKLSGGIESLIKSTS